MLGDSLSYASIIRQISVMDKSDIFRAKKILNEKITNIKFDKNRPKYFFHFQKQNKIKILFYDDR